MASKKPIKELYLKQISEREGLVCISCRHETHYASGDPTKPSGDPTGLFGDAATPHGDPTRPFCCTYVFLKFGVERTPKMALHVFLK